MRSREEWGISVLISISASHQTPTGGMTPSSPETDTPPLDDPGLEGREDVAGGVIIVLRALLRSRAVFGAGTELARARELRADFFSFFFDDFDFGFGFDCGEACA